MGAIGRAIREELRRFERRRLRPLFRWVAPRRLDTAPGGPGGRVDPEPTSAAVEELLVALVRAELRRRTALQDDGSPAGDAPRTASAGLTEAEQLVRSLLDTPLPPTDREARSEAA